MKEELTVEDSSPQPVTAETVNNLRKRLGRPRKSEVIPEQKEEDGLEEELTELAKSLNDLAERVKRLETVPEPTELVTEKNLKPVSSEKGSEIIIAVKKILGQGDTDKCQFSVTTEPGSPGVSFRLTIIPPDHLKENPTDRRVKIVPYLEGIPGSMNYAELVRNYCIKYANNHGISYFV